MAMQVCTVHSAEVDSCYRRPDSNSLENQAHVLDTSLISHPFDTMLEPRVRFLYHQKLKLSLSCAFFNCSHLPKLFYKLYALEILMTMALLFSPCQFLFIFSR